MAAALCLNLPCAPRSSEVGVGMLTFSCRLSVVLTAANKLFHCHPQCIVSVPEGSFPTYILILLIPYRCLVQWKSTAI